MLQLPDLKDAEAVQKFFLEEIQLGEELLAQGNNIFFSKGKLSNNFSLPLLEDDFCTQRNSGESNSSKKMCLFVSILMCSERPSREMSFVWVDSL